MRDRVDGVTEVVNVAEAEAAIDARSDSQSGDGAHVRPDELFAAARSPVTVAPWPACCR